jgi:hypothetical protein
MLFNYNTLRIAAIGNVSKVHISRIVGKGHMRTILLKTGLALGAVTIGVNHAADCSNISGFELGDCGADLSYAADDLMSRNTRIDSWKCAPLASYGVEVRVAYTAEKDFDLNIMFARISSGDCHGSKW